MEDPVDPETVDQNYAQLPRQAQQTAAQIQAGYPQPGFAIF